LSTEYRKYRFSNLLKATLLAPLTTIPVAVIIGLLVLFPTFNRISESQGSPINYINVALLLILFSLPTAYASTTIFGAVGLFLANIARYRLTIPIGVGAGIVCGAGAGFAWMVYLTRDIFDLSGLISTGSYILPISISSGLLVGAVYIKLINRPVLSNSSR
jgi:hypothetical protein